MQQATRSNVGGRSGGQRRLRARPGRRTHRRAMVALCISAGLHALLALVLYGPAAIPDHPPARELRLFVKRMPRSRRPLMRRALPQRSQRPLARRPSLHATRSVAVAPAPLTTRWRGVQEVAVPVVYAPAPDPEVPRTLDSRIRAPEIGPAQRRGAVSGGRHSTAQVDLGLEMLNVEALDTGRHKATVVMDPSDRRNIKGFLYLARAYSPGIDEAEYSGRGRFVTAAGRRGKSFNVASRAEAESQSLQGLAQAMRATRVETRLQESLSLGDPELQRMPFLLLTVNNAFAVTEQEVSNLGKYLTGGGFVYAEVVAVPRRQGNGFATDIPELRGLIRAAMASQDLAEGRDWAFVQLSPDHALFHCYYDVQTLPLGFWDVRTGAGVGYDATGYWGTEDAFWSPPYLEGIELHGELVGLYSQKDYADYWAADFLRADTQGADPGWGGAVGMHCRLNYGTAEEVPVLRLGVNILVYALTREGSLAQKLVSAD